MDEDKNLTASSLSSHHFDNSDWFLQALVKLCNDSESETTFSITLNVGGILVSGELIGGKHYFNGFANTLKMSEFPSDAADVFKDFGEIYTKQREKKEDDKETNPPPQYIHLRNARIFHPGGRPIPTNQGVWWRGRLQAVDGFILGSLSSN